MRGRKGARSRTQANSERDKRWELSPSGFARARLRLAAVSVELVVMVRFVVVAKLPPAAAASRFAPCGRSAPQRCEARGGDVVLSRCQP